MAFQLPSSIAVVKCQAQTSAKDSVSQRNAKADFAAKLAASSSVSPLLQTTAVPVPTNPFSPNDVVLQAAADATEKGGGLNTVSRTPRVYGLMILIDLPCPIVLSSTLLSCHMV